jgi:hypothetical protein
VGESSRDAQNLQSGRLRTYLGTAPGVGKTYAMLNDGWQRSEGGERVVVGWIEHHDRAETWAPLRNLEIVPPRSVAYRGRTFGELDVATIVAGQPDVVLIDELAHANVDGVRKRWEDAAELLATGLSVMTTVNVANQMSVRDYAARVTGAGMVESVPDEFVQSGEVVLVDLAPEALRQRIAAGVYSADRVGGALANYFRTSNLAALSGLGRAWMAGSVDAIAPVVLARRRPARRPHERRRWSQSPSGRDTRSIPGYDPRGRRPLHRGQWREPGRRPGGGGTGPICRAHRRRPPPVQARRARSRLSRITNPPPRPRHHNARSAVTLHGSLALMWIMTSMKQWSDLTGIQQRFILALAAVELALTATALIDLARRPARQVRGPKQLWLLGCVVQPVGPLAYLALGRRPG